MSVCLLLLLVHDMSKSKSDPIKCIQSALPHLYGHLASLSSKCNNCFMCIMWVWPRILFQWFKNGQMVLNINKLSSYQVYTRSEFEMFIKYQSTLIIPVFCPNSLNFRHMAINNDTLTLSILLIQNQMLRIDIFIQNLTCLFPGSNSSCFKFCIELWFNILFRQMQSHI